MDVADASYIGSRAAIQELGQSIMSTFPFDMEAEGSYLHNARGRCNNLLESSGMNSRVGVEVGDLCQSAVSRLLDKARVRKWRATTQPDEVSRLNAYSSQQAGKVYDVIPTDD